MSGFLNQRDIATIVMTATTVFMVLGIIIQSSVMRKRGRRDDRLFFMLLVLDALLAVSEAVSFLGDGKDFPGARYCNFYGITLFYMLFGLFSLLWLYYTDARFFRGNSFIFKHRNAFAIPFILLELLIIINIFAKFIFRVDENNVYHREALFVPMYILFILYIIGGFATIFVYRIKSKVKTGIPVFLYFILMAVILVVPFVFDGISMLSIGLACGLVFTHIGSMNEQMIVSAKEDEYDRG